ncbi:MAG: bifunctional phosphoglucose/phosphomannose isomerase [bacterium]|nr:bifunctional phosphoglucose/phosphomannose isomerase [bacterium]
MIEEAVKNFPKQFAWEPELQNAENLGLKNILVVAGMGGSHLAADIFQMWQSSSDIIVHSDYELSGIPESVLQNSMVVAVSYSGNTEEAISAFGASLKKGIPVAVIAKGGKLLELARKERIPYVQIPDTGVQSRAALGFLLLALLKVAGREDLLKEAQHLQNSLYPEVFKEQGEEIAKELSERIPVIYASRARYHLAYIWKVKLNEGAKIPAFCSVLPEANHNEMNGFDVVENTRELSGKFYPVFLLDEQDDPRVQKRMAMTKKMYEKEGLSCLEIPVQKGSFLQRVFSSVLLADWVAFYLAQYYGTDPEQVPMVEEFKKLIA